MLKGVRKPLKPLFKHSKKVGKASIEAGAIQSCDYAAKILISNGLEPDKGLGRKLDGIAELMATQENLRRSRLGYNEATRGKLGWKIQGKQQIRSNLYCYFTNPIISSKSRGSTHGAYRVDIPHGTMMSH
ncbi:hypothetical protein CR513_47316, partial [Mucuna pruriens]